MNEDWNHFWWRHIPGTQHFLHDVVVSLEENGVVIVAVPEDLPWRKQMRSAICEMNITEEVGYPEFLDCQDDNMDTLLPGRFVLAKTCPNNSYRSGNKETSSQYLVRTRALEKRFIWIKGVPKECIKEWLDFGVELSGVVKPAIAQDEYHGAVVIELHDHADVVKKEKIVRYEKYVTVYDAKNMISLIMNSNDDDYNLNSNQISYFVELVSSLCGIDVEIAFEFISLCRKNHTMPIFEMLQQIAIDFPRRGADRVDHILARIRERKRWPEIKRSIWEAQIKILFSQIEFERVKTIQDYQQSLKSRLKSLHTQLTDIQNIDELEIGQLAWLATAGGVHPFPLDVANRVRFLRDCRNKLAHLEICSPEDIDLLLS